MIVITIIFYDIINFFFIFELGKPTIRIKKSIKNGKHYH